MLSGQAAGVTPGYVFDTVTELGDTQPVLQLRTGNLECFRIESGGNMLVMDKQTPTAFVLYGFKPTLGTGLRLYSQFPELRCLLPYLDKQGSLGDTSNRWRGVYSTLYSTATQALTWSASFAIHVGDGAYTTLTLTGDTTITAINGGASGTTATLKLTQDGSGSHKLTLPATVKTRGPFTLSLTAAAVDYLFLEYDGTNWIEVGRRVQEPLETRVTARDVSVGGVIEIKVGLDTRKQVFVGTLAADFELRISPVGAVNGDEFLLIFPDTSGLVTTTTETFIVKTTGGSPMVTLADNKTLKGQMLLYHDGASWNASYRGTTLYA